MRRLLTISLVLALVGAGAALGARGDPQKRITPADQARARAMLLRTVDLGPTFTAVRLPDSGGNFYCRALDESDLVQSGEATSPQFRRGLTFVSSLAQVYASSSDASASWRRGQSPAGERCAREQLRRGFAVGGIRLVSFRRVAFPPLARGSLAYRLVLESQGVPVYIDVVVLMHARAHASILAGAAVEPLSRSELVRLARAVAARMAVAMRGS